MKKLVNNQNSKEKLTSIKKKKYNTIQTYDQSEYKSHSRKLKTQLENSVDKSIGSYSTKSKNKREIRWDQIHSNQINERKISATNLKNKKSINKKLSFKKTDLKLKSKSASKFNKFKKEQKQIKQKPDTLTMSNFQTFQPKTSFIQGYIAIKKIMVTEESILWSARSQMDKKYFFIKQSKTQNELKFNDTFFFEGGKVKREYVKHPGIKNLAKILKIIKKSNILWIIYQPFGQIFNNSLYKVNQASNVIDIQYRHFYDTLKLKPNLLKIFMLQCCKSLSILQDKQIIHGNIRGDNIFITLKQNTNKKNIEISKIVLGSFQFSFYFKQLQKKLPNLISEYTPPEILNFILFQTNTIFDRKILQYLQNYTNSWVIDIWALGLLILQTIIGFPFKYNNGMISTNKSKPQLSFFRSQDSIKQTIQKQFELVFNLDKILQDKKKSNIKIDVQMQFILKRMLSIDPKKRISPKQIIQILKY